MTLFIEQHEADMIGTTSGNSADPGASVSANLGLADACTRLVVTAGAFGLAVHLMHQSEVWRAGAMTKQEMRLKGEAPEVLLGKAAQLAEAYAKEEKARKEAQAEKDAKAQAEKDAKAQAKKGAKAEVAAVK